MSFFYNFNVIMVNTFVKNNLKITKMKKSISLILFICYTVSIYAKNDLNAILTSYEWQLNYNQTFLHSDPSISEDKLFNLEKITQHLNVFFLFDKKNNLSIKLEGLEVFSGQYQINKNKLIFSNNKKEYKNEYEVISFSKDKILLHNKKYGIDLILTVLKEEPNLKSILVTNDWRLDIESMKLKLIFKATTSPQMKELNDEDREIAVKSTLIAMGGIRYHFDEDYKVDCKIYLKDEIQYQTKGTFSIDDIKNELTIDTLDEPNRIFKIIKVEENKVTLLDYKSELEYILIPVNKK